MKAYEDLVRDNEDLRRENEALRRQIEKLEKRIEQLHRGSKRQAAPFSKGAPMESPKRPGRKRGKEYGARACRPVPEQVDERVEVGCPLFCEVCNGKVRLAGKESQFQIDLPEIRPRTTEFVLHYGKCQSCGRRVVGRDWRQTSEAVGAAGVQIGPRVVATATLLNKVGGLSYGKIATFLEQVTGLFVSRSTLCRAVQRAGAKAQPIYDDLIEVIRGSSVVYPDESGWRVGGSSALLWVFTNRRETVYSIQRGRGFAEASSVLGKDYAGALVADGWPPYRRFDEPLANLSATGHQRAFCLDYHSPQRRAALIYTAQLTLIA